MNITAIIPARWGSTRLPGKPLQMIAGKPMVQWVYERTKQSDCLSRVIVATDDQRIIDCVEGFGGEALMSVGEYATGSDRIAGVAAQLGLSDESILLNVQGDQPLVHPKSLSQLINSFLQNEKHQDEMATLVYPMAFEDAQDPTMVKTVMDHQGYALYFSRNTIPYGRDVMPDKLCIHLGVYIYSLYFLKQFQRCSQGYLEELEKLEQLRVLEHGYKIKVIVSDYDSPEVDSQKDIDRIEGLIAQGKF